MKKWAYVVAYRASNGDPSFGHCFVTASSEEDAYTAGAHAIEQKKRVADALRKGRGINDYVIRLT